MLATLDAIAPQIGARVIVGLLDPHAVRSLFSLRAQYRQQAGAMFGRG